MHIQRYGQSLRNYTFLFILNSNIKGMKYFLNHFNFKIINRKANFFLISFNKGEKDEIKLKLKSKNKFLALKFKNNKIL